MESVSDLMRHYRALFAEVDAPKSSDGGKWSLSPGVVMPPPMRAPLHEDYSVHDTPPGQKVYFFYHGRIEDNLKKGIAQS